MKSHHYKIHYTLPDWADWFVYQPVFKTLAAAKRRALELHNNEGYAVRLVKVISEPVEWSPTDGEVKESDQAFEDLAEAANLLQKALGALNSKGINDHAKSANRNPSTASI